MDIEMKKCQIEDEQVVYELVSASFRSTDKSAARPSLVRHFLPFLVIS